ncbi:MAG: aminoacetone oxidase family FAD-binding enzyme, partial [Candidatus Omnitrophica bacterium]|nr:aminoacetone oxidase family FAD-binding enzyme [Candidatus Omnitrophota bacterium]
LSEIGELLFTSFGVSGPLVLTLSGRVVDSLAGGVPVAMEIDLKPALSTEQLHTRLLREFAQNPRKSLRNIFKEFLPQRLVDIFIEIAKMKVSQKVSYVTQKERQELVRLLKSFRVDIRKARPIEEGMVTCGGVSLKEINPRTMESRLIKGLFFAGEIIDVHADTGGFNLQAAFSTGYLAGESAAVN